ncbi:long-chain acyl-CoA synthetase [Catalinimonas alkaloidigena]|uniref:Long-chain-fatty-acid--CoA ligase n=1 Tax=Catalinimonas alkaloidigena TaxID=1075417 RepID=A0A1G9EM73_9BACT|nr:AMP-binding protein [Catalinimonas alkaloidigena]SDK77188.1 long-chain acyl-CoA synthetase [Catalinimonas alkaloidigena]
MSNTTTPTEKTAMPWLNSYPEGVTWDIDPAAYSNVVEMLEEMFARYGDHEAQENLGYTMTYDQLEEASCHFAAFLQSNGLKPGDRIALQMPNVLQYLVALYGAIRAGLTIVNLNPLYTASEMLKPLRDSDAKAIVILANFADKLEKILPETKLQLVVVTEVGDMLPPLKRTLINAVVKYVKKMVPAFQLPQAISFTKALRSGRNQTYQKPSVSSDQTLFLQYTGGTTGVPKAADLSHANIVANVLQSKEWYSRLKPGQEVLLAALPFYHIFGLTVNSLFLMHLGAKLILITNPRDMPGFIKTMQKHRFTVFTGLNTLFNGLMNQADFTSIKFPENGLYIAGGMALQQAVGERWLQLTGCPIVEGYGLSETSPVLTCNHPLQNRPGTIGLPLPRTELRIMDDQGQEVPMGERGEICARGPQVMKGYFKQPEETKRVFFAGGWFRTGDVGVMDEGGYVRIVDRMKDMILVSGFNVYPNEVEDEIAKHPGVLECAVVGMPDSESTERVKACIVRKDPNLTEEDVITHCRKTLTGYKVPKHVQFYDQLPKSNVGKILRRELR